MPRIKVECRGKKVECEKGTTLLEFSKVVKDEFKTPILVGTINNKLTSLHTQITRDCTVDFFDYTSACGNHSYQRGLQFLLCKAVKDVLNCDIKISHNYNSGFFCEVLTNNIISEVTIQKIKMRMRDLIEAEIPITKIMVSRIDAIDYYNNINQLDKAKTLRYISNSSVSLYKIDDTLDYFYGVLPYNTKVFSRYNLKYLKDNKFVLLYPYFYDINQELKYVKNDMLLESLEKNEAYLQRLDISTSAELNKNISNGSYSDLIRISESLQNNKLLELSKKISEDKDIKLILITGPSSSGKTTISKKLSLYLKSMGLTPIPISVDDFYTDIDKRVLDENGNPENERIEAIDTNLFNKKISELLNGMEVVMPKYNFVKGKQEYDEKPIKISDDSILIIEGIHAFNEKLTEIIPDKNKFKLFICPLTPLNIDNHNIFRMTDNRLLRRIIRDNKFRGSSASETLKLWKEVRKAEEEFILPYMNLADEIFNTSLVYELGVLKTYAEPLLFSVEEDDPNYEEAIRLINLFRVILGMPSDKVPDDSILREFIGGSCFKD